MYIKRYKFIACLLTILCLLLQSSIIVNALDGGFGASDKNGEWSTETRANIFYTTRYNNNLLYPGSENVYTFKVLNSGEKYTTCRLTIEDKNDYKLPMEFKLKKNGEYIIGTDDSWYSTPRLDTGMYKFRGIDEYELEWRWQYLVDEESERSERNSYETSIGERALKEDQPYYLNIVLYGEGGTDEPEVVVPDKPEPTPSRPVVPSNPDVPTSPTPSTPPYPSIGQIIPDFVKTGDTDKLILIYFGILLVMSLIVMIIGGVIDDKINKNRKD